MSNAKATLTRLADLANIPKQPLRQRHGAMNGWLSRRPVHLPASSVPDVSVMRAESVSSMSLFPRAGHTTSNPTPDGDVYIFGGYTESSILTYLNDLWLYSTKDNTATLIECSGDLPTTRAWSSISLTGKVLALWGGGTIFDKFDDAVYLLDLVSHEWTQIKIHGWAPVGREKHAFATVGSALVVFGGYSYTANASSCLNDIWSFDLDTLRNQPAWEFIKPSSQTNPLPRYGHQWILHQNQLITFGGCNGTRPYYDDVWSFDLATSRWTGLPYAGPTPSGRICHAGTIVNDIMYIYGGINTECFCDLVMFNIPRQERLILEPTPAGPRSGHSMVSVDSSLYVLGGQSVVQRNDMDLVYILDTEKLLEELGLQSK